MIEIAVITFYFAFSLFLVGVLGLFGYEMLTQKKERLLKAITEHTTAS